MLVELHILQNFAPSNLNRDETGSPKDCEFGGYRRARVSSQCWKRAIRTTFGKEELIDEEHLAKRSKRVGDEVAKRLEKAGRPAAQCHGVAEAAMRGMGLKVEKGKSEYLLFLSDDEIERLAVICEECWDELAQIAAQLENGVKSKDAKKEGKAALSTEARHKLATVLDQHSAVDLALFGRMLADMPEKNVDAAAQVAHAISTNRVSVEFDYYTAMDDLKPRDEAGADMLGTVEFNSACFYRYINVDLGQLVENLNDEDLAKRALRAFMLAAVQAVPSGKQSSMAAQNPPSLVLAVARKRGLWSLANAFVRPVRPNEQGDLVQNSVAALDAYWGKLRGMYGENSLIGTWCASLDSELHNLADNRVDSLDVLIDEVLATARFRPEIEEALS